MAKYYSKKERETIERLNNLLGMSHRSKPYDFNNIDDLREAFTMTVAKYIDYLKYSMTILDIEENFDESLEYFDPVTWTSLHDNNVEGDELAQNVSSYLRKTGNYLNDLSNRSEEKCKELLVLVLDMTAEIRVTVLGKKYIYDEEAIESVFENCMDIKYTYNVDESRDAFIEVLDRFLAVEK